MQRQPRGHQSRRILADTTPLYAAVNPDDQYHRRATEDLRRLREAGLYLGIPWSTVMETYSLILHRLGTHVAVRWLSEVRPATAFLQPAEEDFQSSLTTIARFPDQQVTLFDALLYSMSVRLGEPVWSYDHHFDILRARRWYGESQEQG